MARVEERLEDKNEQWLKRGLVSLKNSVSISECSALLGAVPTTRQTHEFNNSRSSSDATSPQ